MKVKRLTKYLAACIAVIIMAGCTTDPEVTVTDQEYMPLRKGLYHIYEITGTLYSVTDPPAELHYELKTVVVDSFQHEMGGYTYVIHRFIREDESDSWVYEDTWSARVDNNRAVVSEGNTDFVKLRFPASQGIEWDGNAFNTLDEDEYTILSKGKAYTAGTMSFDDCVEVEQNFLDDVIVMTDIRYEVYARGVGLIERKETILNFCTSNCQVFGSIEYGIEYTQAIKEYGVE